MYAAAAKSLQSCPILCDPIDGSLPGSPIPGILQARTLKWVVISFSDAWKWKVKVESLSRVRLLVTPWVAIAFCVPQFYVLENLLRLQPKELLMLSSVVISSCQWERGKTLKLYINRSSMRARTSAIPSTECFSLWLYSAWYDWHSMNVCPTFVEFVKLSHKKIEFSSLRNAKRNINKFAVSDSKVIFHDYFLKFNKLWDSFIQPVR